MQQGLALRRDGLKYEDLAEKDRKAADTGAWHIKVAMAMVVFVVLCFLTECIPLPGVSFCVGLLLVFTGVALEKRCSHALLGRRRLVYHGQPHVCRGPG